MVRENKKWHALDFGSVSADILHTGKTRKLIIASSILLVPLITEIRKNSLRKISLPLNQKEEINEKNQIYLDRARYISYLLRRGLRNLGWGGRVGQSIVGDPDHFSQKSGRWEEHVMWGSRVGVGLYLALLSFENGLRPITNNPTCRIPMSRLSNSGSGSERGYRLASGTCVVATNLNVCGANG